MNYWGTQYIEWDMNGGSFCSVYGVWAQALEGRKLGWALLGLRNNGRVTEIQRGIGDEFFRGLINSPLDPYDKLVLVTAGIGQDSASSYKYAFDLSLAPGYSILAPLASDPEFVGSPEDPGRFLLKAHITGPGLLRPFGLDNPSVRGLDPSEFEVVLRSSATGTEYPATLVNADYVDGEYWMAVQAPEVDEDADGITYDVVFTILGGGFCPTEVSEEAVIYDEQVVFQVHTVDRSGSMSEPEPVETSKLEAAKIAVALQIDAGDDDDSMGLVRFSGDNEECTGDALVSSLLTPLPGNRDALKGMVSDLSAEGLTSIGDGVKLALAVLLGPTMPFDKRLITLYSDGLENEGDFLE